jgi:hypothetical protein
LVAVSGDAHGQAPDKGLAVFSFAADGRSAKACTAKGAKEEVNRQASLSAGKVVERA